MNINLGKLVFNPVEENGDLVCDKTLDFINSINLKEIYVTEIDPGLADTEAFCKHYEIGLDISANCVIVQAKRADKVWYAACMILATNRADINNVVRRHLEARKLSFAPMDLAVSLTEMEYGGINPIGLPKEWPILVDQNVAGTQNVIIGSGKRNSKLYVPSKLLLNLPNAVVLDMAIKP